MGVKKENEVKTGLVDLLLGNRFGITTSTPEEDFGGVAPPSGIRTPDGSYVPGRKPGDKIRTGPINIPPRKPSKDKKKRDKNNKFAV